MLRCEEIYNAIKPKRAEAIEAALSIEGILDMVLLDLLVGSDEPRREILRECVLFPEFCSAFQKWKMFSRLAETLPLYFASLTKAEISTLKRDTKDLMSDRNKFAHGDLFVDGRDFVVYLRYFEDGTKWVAVTDDFLNNLINKASECRNAFSALHAAFEAIK